MIATLLAKQQYCRPWQALEHDDSRPIRRPAGAFRFNVTALRGSCRRGNGRLCLQYLQRYVRQAKEKYTTCAIYYGNFSILVKKGHLRRNEPSDFPFSGPGSQ